MLNKWAQLLPHNIMTYLRSCIHTQRYTGYVNKFPVSSKHESIGFIVRNDQPDKEYLFHVDDLKSEDIECVRQYQQVEFEIMDGSPYKKAKHITAPCRIPLKYNHRNSAVNKELRTQRLSQLQHQSPNQRHTGIVESVNLEQKNGFIIPTRIYCDLIYFDFSEIHSTGIARVEANDFVSFCVANGGRRDVALSIRRSDNGLITFEDYTVGNIRRSLGNAYGKEDKFANVAPQYLDNRYRGYIIHRHADGLLGYILVFDDDNAMRDELVSVHVDNCHMFGNRKLRRFQEIEFCIECNVDHRYKFKAVHVTAPNLHILRYDEENHLLNAVNDKAMMLSGYDKEECEMQQRFDGIVTKIKRCNEDLSRLYELTPNTYGHKRIYAHNSEIRTVGNKALRTGDAVEYHVDYRQQRAFHVTAQGGHPFLCEHSNSEYSKYLRSKLHLCTFRRDFEVYDGDFAQGFITSFDGLSECGTIEVIARKDVRYKNILFHAKDADKRRLHRIKNQKVSFDLVEMSIINGSNHSEFIYFVTRNDLDLTKRAVNIKLADVKDSDTKEIKSNMCINNVRHRKLTQINQIVMQQKLSHLRY